MKKELVFVSNTKNTEQVDKGYENNLVGYYVQIIDLLFNSFDTKLTFVIQYKNHKSNLYKSIKKHLKIKKTLN